MGVAWPKPAKSSPGHSGGKSLMLSDSCIVEECKESWDEQFVANIKNSNNCSGFVKSVANKLGVPLPQAAQADGIVDAIEVSWTKIHTGIEAAKKAAEGFLVVAGLRSGEHAKKTNQGHVVIIVSGPLYRSKYPRCWGGSTGTAQSNGNKSVGEVWSTADRDNVTYYFYRRKVCQG